MDSALLNDFAEKKILMAKTWFYKLFENIIAREAKNPKYDIKVCSKFVEILIYIYLYMLIITFYSR